MFALADSPRRPSPRRPSPRNNAFVLRPQHALLSPPLALDLCIPLPRHPRLVRRRRPPPLQLDRRHRPLLRHPRLRHPASRSPDILRRALLTRQRPPPPPQQQQAPSRPSPPLFLLSPRPSSQAVPLDHIPQGSLSVGLIRACSLPSLFVLHDSILYFYAGRQQPLLPRHYLPPPLPPYPGRAHPLLLRLRAPGTLRRCPHRPRRRRTRPPHIPLLTDARVRQRRLRRPITCGRRDQRRADVICRRGARMTLVAPPSPLWSPLLSRPRLLPSHRGLPAVHTALFPQTPSHARK
ncbi:hypothetical protein BV25DRAFT_79087 [Artomyces pyxidatus]|uniref:Uncharacterized protein n=1 Tax=Artomyces pyxidatus TaxID=48021 RepID=A0ACB8TKX2_9AGAM|nr:hypothetical protein BV25DRAFT_79087 [Artomyces pyxidatus]